MNKDILSEILSSPNSLGIAALISVRPRTQSELAESTGVSVPAVLKHLRRLEELGLVEQKKLKGGPFSVRRIYAKKEVSVGDFSQTDFRVVKLRKESKAGSALGDPLPKLGALAEDLLLQKRRIRDQVRRLGRMIDQLLEDQDRLSRTAIAYGLGTPESLILQTVFTEEDVAEAERTLARHYGLKGGRRSIDRVISEAARNAKK